MDTKKESRLLSLTVLISLIVLSLIVVGCDGGSNNTPNIREDLLKCTDIVNKNDPSLQATLNAMKEHMSYMEKDGLCYAVVFVLAGGGYPIPVMTNIPCPEQ